jgi:hypothetical protein
MSFTVTSLELAVFVTTYFFSSLNVENLANFPLQSLHTIGSKKCPDSKP